jgi:hypothetical protein
VKKTKASGKFNKFTVIGYYADNAQPFVEFIIGRDETDALKSWYRILTSKKDGTGLEKLWIVGVFAGWQRETGNLSETTRLVDMFEEEMPEEVEA